MLEAKIKDHSGAQGRSLHTPAVLEAVMDGRGASCQLCDRADELVTLKIARHPANHAPR